MQTMKEYGYYLGGQFKKSGDAIDVANPATEEVFARIFEAGQSDLDEALAMARQAQRSLLVPIHP